MRAASSRPPFFSNATERASEGNANPRGWTAHDRSMPGDRPRKRPPPRMPVAVAALSVTEAQFQRQVLALAEMYGWLCYHTYDARRSQPGFPDLTLVKPPRVLFVELKQQRGRVRPEQTDWLAMLAACPGVESYLWRPSDFDRIVTVLSASEAPRNVEGEVEAR